MSSPSQDKVTADGHLESDEIAGDGPAELAASVDELLNGLEKKFTSVSTEILAKIDEMSKRLDTIEATLQSGDSEEHSS
ncbi:hypothetical protein L228DRAFT_264959 [Xylona heveae TC161]|uniref:Heat shock factor binding protein 1 n=1 Tax=Xylona heveae (strain CBS 132557 / TC161) TaxID=1328760 RepID=A0A165JSX3_XYLHT|nr:hypothetical protein L228DRAFT_264959 [Xylona heveae TC161]KZF26580.1 hypothetical protein L228DRAFT_264959 [Xylona heveae TC161]